jgi:hypothetical protein
MKFRKISLERFLASGFDDFPMEVDVAGGEGA